MMNGFNYKDCCLIVTGCMFPQCDVKNLAIKDYRIRQQQYIESLKWYINETSISRIVYCDNSNALCPEGLIELAETEGKVLEWLPFQGNSDKVLEKGKGYGEGEILDYAVHNSQLVSESDVLIKITGRLKPLNISSILQLSRRRYSYFEMHDGYVDSRCYIVKKEDYIKYLLGVNDKVDDYRGYYIEHVLYDEIQKYPKRFHPLPFALNISGMSGSMGVEYKDGVMLHIAKDIKRIVLAVKWKIEQH